MKRPVQRSSRRRLSPSGQNSWSYDASGCNGWIGTNDALRWLAMILLKKRTWWRDGVSEMEGGVFVWVWIVCYCFSVFLLSHHGICFVQSFLVLWSKVWNLMIATAPKTSIAAQPLKNDGWSLWIVLLYGDMLFVFCFFGAGDSRCVCDILDVWWLWKFIPGLLDGLLGLVSSPGNQWSYGHPLITGWGPTL